MEDQDAANPSPRSGSSAPSSPQYNLPSRPANPRSSTDPSPTALLQTWLREKEKTDLVRPTSSHRNRSPYSRSHLRSRSSGSGLLSAPLMTRAHSLPNPTVLDGSRSGSLSPNPQQYSPGRARSPAKGADEGYMPPPRSPGWSEGFFGSGSGIEAIEEEGEMDVTPRPHSSYSTNSPNNGYITNGNTSPLPPSARNNTTPNAMASINLASRRRPSSPSPTSHPASPTLGPTRYNESIPALTHYASTSSFSSVPSTPTSARSRSPSISSLDTIEDAPEDEEEESEAAVEAERLQRVRLRLAAEGEEREGGRKGSLDSRRGLGLGIAKGERKRWSVCGGERRGDLSLGTIWED